MMVRIIEIKKKLINLYFNYLGGDLRAQLSRKRAERQHKLPPTVEDVQTRLLQNALDDAVFKKSKKLKRYKEKKDKGKFLWVKFLWFSERKFLT